MRRRHFQDAWHSWPVRVPAEILVCVCPRCSLGLEICDMWGAVKFLVPEFGLTALLLTSGPSWSPLTSGNKGFTAPVCRHSLFGPHIVFLFLSLPLLWSLSSTFVAMATVPSWLLVEGVTSSCQIL